MFNLQTPNDAQTAIRLLMQDLGDANKTNQDLQYQIRALTLGYRQQIFGAVIFGFGLGIMATAIAIAIEETKKKNDIPVTIV